MVEKDDIPRIPEETQRTATDEAVDKPQRKKRNKWKITGTVVAVIVVLGVAFFVWHNTPGFCNAVCHKPMDPYVATFDSNDKGMMAVVHRDANLGCLSCHEAKLTEQVSEVMMWVSDEFTTDANGKLVPTVNYASTEFCARSGCHKVDSLVSATRGFAENPEQYNPHSSHQDLALECGDCHKAHSKSVLVCNDCHALNVPDGWES